MSRRAEATTLAVVLLVLNLTEGAVLFFITDPVPRLVLGILLLGPIIYTGSKLGVVDHFLQMVSRTSYARRDTRMRARVDQLLEEVRRLNAIAVDGKRGVRRPEQTTELMDSCETKIRELVTQIRDAAGEGYDQPLETQ